MPSERYIFSAEGHGNVIKAYDTVASAAEAAGERIKRAGVQGGGSGGRGGGGPGRGVGGRGGARTAEDRELQRLESRLRREIAIEERAESKKAAIRKRAMDGMVRERDRNRAKDRAANSKMVREAERALMRRASAEKRIANAALRDKARRREQRWGVAGEASYALVGGAIGAGSMLAGRALHEGMSLQDRATALSIQGSSSKDGRVNATRLRESFEKTAVDVRGARSDDVAGGVEAFVTKTGKLDEALKFQKVMAETAVATGSSASVLGDAMADLYTKFDITSVEEMSKAMAVLAAQGKQGSFELKDAAAQFPSLAAAAQRLGIGKGVDAVATLGGLAQITRTTTKSSHGANTALSAAFRQLTSKSAVLKKKYGVHVFEEKDRDEKQADGTVRHIKKGDARNIKQVLVDMISKVGGMNMEKKKVGLQKILGDEGSAGVSALQAKFTQSKKTTQAGREAELMDFLNESINTIGAETQMREDLIAAQSTASAATTHAWETFKAQINAKALPAFAELATRAADLATQLDFGLLADGTLMLVEAFADLVGVISVAADTMGIKRKERPAEERARNASDKINELTARKNAILAGSGVLTPQNMPALSQQRYRIIDEQLQKQRAEKARAESEMAAAQPDLLGTISRSDFTKRFGEMGGSNWSAQVLADAVQKDPEHFNVEEAMPVNMRFNDGAKSLLQNYVSSVQAQQSGERASNTEAAANGQGASAAREINASLGAAAAAAQVIKNTLEKTDVRTKGRGIGL